MLRCLSTEHRWHLSPSSPHGRDQDKAFYMFITQTHLVQRQKSERSLCVMLCSWHFDTLMPFKPCKKGGEAGWAAAQETHLEWTGRVLWIDGNQDSSVRSPRPLSVISKCKLVSSGQGPHCICPALFRSIVKVLLARNTEFIYLYSQALM